MPRSEKLASSYVLPEDLSFLAFLISILNATHDGDGPFQGEQKVFCSR